LPVTSTWLEGGQRFGKRAEQQALALHREEVLAVDPDQVDRAVGGAAGGFLRAHAFDHLGRVGDLDVFELHAMALLQFCRSPLQVGVDALAAGPGVEVDRLAARAGFNGGPGAGALGPQAVSARLACQGCEPGGVWMERSGCVM
jgi:hypothetical protein